VGVVTLSRMKRAFVADTLWVVTLAVLAVALATVVKLVPLALTWMLNACVLKLVLSPPAPACRTTNWLTLNVLPRSTWRNLVAAPEHHLSLRPPVTLPFTALAGPSFELHGALTVAGLFRARFDGEGVGGGGFGGGVGPPRWNTLT